MITSGEADTSCIMKENIKASSRVIFQKVLGKENALVRDNVGALWITSDFDYGSTGQKRISRVDIVKTTNIRAAKTYFGWGKEQAESWDS